MTLSGCSLAVQVLESGPMNGSRKPMLFWKLHFGRRKELAKFGVPAAAVRTGFDKQRLIWVNIFASMDLRQATSGGLSMVNPIV